MQIAKIKEKYPKIKIKNEIVNSIEKNLEKALENVDIETSTDINKLDTIAKAFDYTENIEKRNEVLNRLIPLAQEAFSQSNDSDENLKSIIDGAKSMSKPI